MKCLIAISLLLALPLCARPTAPYVALIANTGSMRPTLQGGEKILVLPCPWDKVQVGMVIVFERAAQGLFVCHRVIAVRVAANGKRYLVTKGDANREPDPVEWHVTEDEFIGVLDVPFKTGT